MKRIIVLFSCVLFTTMTVLAEMTAKASWTQCWPWQTNVDIDVDLAGGTKCDVAISASFTTNGVPVTLDLEQNGLVGDPWELDAGYHHFTWDPAMAGFDVKVLKDFSVTVTPIENAATARAWLVLDMATGSYEYLAEGEARSVDANGCPWKDDVYRTSKMVFRRIPAGTFTMGYTAEQKNHLKTLSGKDAKIIPAHEVTLRSDYYIAITPATGGQINRLNSEASKSTANSSYYGDTGKIGGGRMCFLRGSNDVDNVKWPATKYAVKSGTWVDLMRTRAKGGLHIDLATVAQWQKAARPDPEWLWYSSTMYTGGCPGGTTSDDAEALTNVLSKISQVTDRLTKGYGLYSQSEVAMTYYPNRYGVYDTIANRVEFVLDQYADSVELDATNSSFTSTETEDPLGITFQPQRRMLMNSYVVNKSLITWSICLCGGMYTDTPTNNKKDALDASDEYCFRFAIHLKPPKSFNGQWE